MISATPRTVPRRRGDRVRAASGASVILFNKPHGVLCQFSVDGTARRTLKDFIAIGEVYPAGRLDADSEGLVILTADGALQATLTHPRYKCLKTYWVQVEGAVNEAALRQLRSGVALNDGPTRPASARAIDEPAGLWPREPPIRVRRAIPTTWLELVLAEGRNRQARRMTAAVGYPTLRLIRSAVGPWSLDGLLPGAWREESAALRVLSSPPTR